MKNFPKIFIPSYNRPEEIKTLRNLDGYDPVIVLHSDEQLDLYRQYNPDLKYVVTNVPVGEYGVIKTRNYIQDNLVEDGEWFIMFDDNNHKITKVQDEYYPFQFLDVKSDKKYQDIYNQQVTLKDIEEDIIKDIKLAERTNIYHIAYAPNENYFFRPTKYRNIGYTKGNATITRKDGVRWDENLKSMCDYTYPCQQLVKYGKVLINYFICFHKKHYSPGGIGTYDSRLPMKLHDTKYLMEKYAGLLRYSIKKNMHPESDLTFRITNMNSFKRWRHQYLRNEKNTIS